MKNIVTIAKKELLGYFLSPVGYIFAGLLMVVCGSLFFNDLFLSGQADLRPYWGVMGFLLSLFIPALTMGLIADEKKNGTWETLLSLPIGHLQVIVGKFVGCLIYLVFVLLLSTSTVVTVFLLGKPDLGLVFGGIFGLLLMSGVYLSLGIFMSSLTTQSVVAFLATSIVLILNNMMGQEFLLVRLPPLFRDIVGGLSLAFRSSKFSSGLIEIGDLIFFVSWIVIFLTLATLSLRSKDR